MKRLIYYLMLVLVLCSFVSAGDDLTTNIARVYHFNDSVGGQTTEEIIGDNADISGATFDSSGFVEGSYYFTTNDYMSIDKEALPLTDITNPFSIVVLLNWSCPGEAQKWVDGLDSADVDGISFGTSASGAIGLFILETSSNYAQNYISCNVVYNNLPITYIVTYDGSKTAVGINIYENGTLQVGTDNSGGSLPDDTGSTVSNITLGARNDGANQWMTGYISEILFYDEELNQSQVTAIVQNHSAKIVYPFVVSGGTPPVDVTSPTITNITQYPDNITANNVFESIVNITAYIQDETALNYSSIFMNVTLGNISVYVNGTLTSLNTSYLSNYNASPKYGFQLDDNKFLPATYNYPEKTMENTVHKNGTINGLNSFLKIQFFNVSGEKRGNFIEIYEQNILNVTDGVDYYYCNEDYITGNPVSHNNCTLFAKRTTNKFNHTHNGNSLHNVIPLGIDTSTGTINGVAVTSTSYIIVRGLVGGVRYFYIDDYYRISAQTSNNNGNTWINLVGTIDSHIRQYSGDNTESINYKICAQDTSNNLGCSSIYTDWLEYPIVPPNSVNILSPIADTYNITIDINHTASFSASGQTITGYKYEYKRTDLSSWIEIKDNNYPLLTYSWDISNILNGEYQIRITVTDSLNLTSTTLSEVFTIENPLTYDQQLLLLQLEELQDIGGVIMLLGIYIIIGVFIFAGIKSQHYILWAISSLFFVAIGIYYIGDYNTSDFYKMMVWLNILLGALFSILGTVFAINIKNNKNKEKMNKDFYPNY